MPLKIYRLFVLDFFKTFGLIMSLFSIFALFLQILKIAEFFGEKTQVSFTDLAHMMGLSYLTFLPLVLPLVSLVTTSLLTWQWSSDGSFLGLISIGLNPKKLLLTLWALVSVLMFLQTYLVFELAPNIKQKLNLIGSTLKNTQKNLLLQPKTFQALDSGLVVFFQNQVGDKMQNVFIHDPVNNPLMVVTSSSAHIINLSQSSKNESWLILDEGMGFLLDKKALVNFGELKVRIDSELNSQASEDLESWNFRKMIQSFKNVGIQKQWFKRLSLIFATLILGLLGFAHNFSLNQRSQSNFAGMMVTIVIFFYLFFMIGESIDRPLTALFLFFLPNLMLLGWTIWKVRQKVLG